MSLSVSISKLGGYVAEAPLADKLSADDVLLVAYQMVHSFPGGVAAVADAVGMSKGTLTHKLNPTNFHHHLTLREALLIQKALGSAALLQSEAAFLGYSCGPMARRLDVLPPAEALTTLVVAFGQFLQALSDPINRAAAQGAGPLDAVSQSELNRADFHAVGLLEAIADSQEAMRALRRPTPAVGGR